MYNIINFVPSPLNYAVTINLNIFYNSQNPKNKSTSGKNLPIVNKDIIPQRKEGRKFTKNTKKKLDNLLKEENNNMIVKPKNNFQDIKFEILSGYPLIQYNLLKVLLYKLLPEDVITIFFYTFLERNVLFFSNDIELLSLTINSYINLNFPLNDEKYYFNGVSISFDDYIGGN